jgi:hypothetical protein
MKKFKIGDLVAVNTLPDCQVYHVYEQHHKNNFMFYLTYYSNGKLCGGGWLDVSAFREPSKDQLKNYIATSLPAIGLSAIEDAIY